MTGQKFILTQSGWRQSRQEMYFCYTIVTDEQNFELEETITLPKPAPGTYETEQLHRALHIALATSYYKAFVPPTIEHPYAMTDVEASFWNTVFEHGLGEFMYKNSLKTSQLARFIAQEGEMNTAEPQNNWSKKAMLGIGGGKDSIVAGELLKEAGVDIEGFVLATGDALGQTKAVADVMEIPLHTIKRVVDPKILEINNLDGAMNGHIPISLVFGLIGSMLATIEQSSYVIVANEASSSIPQVEHDGAYVNHQWSKSLEFERLFHDYLHSYVTKELKYFSAVRPLTSIAVAKIFAQYPSYFEVFTSDNSLFKIKQQERDHPRWSRSSSKSLSSYMLFTPWLKPDELTKIFGYDFLNDESLKPMFTDLLGHNGASVLDCVGTPEELRLSLGLAQEKDYFNNTALMDYAVENNLIDNPSKLPDFLLLQDHNIPPELSRNLCNIMENKL